EDGIRARNVTGVQTCALPISASSGIRCGASDSYINSVWGIFNKNRSFFLAAEEFDCSIVDFYFSVPSIGTFAHILPFRNDSIARSEERRVGTQRCAPAQAAEV